VAALAVALFTLPLLFMGGLVTSTGAGMSVPDWPTSFGYGMFSLPFDLWRGPVFTEHSHRILGASVGIVTILALGTTLAFDRRRSVKLLALGVVLLVSAQGVLGGMRVVLVEHGLAPVHGSFAQLVFAVMAAFVTVTGRGWLESRALAAPVAAVASLRRVAWALVGLAFLQVLLGAWYRHDAAARIEPHALNAFALLALAIVLTKKLKKTAAGRGWLLSSSKVLHALLGAQLLLGFVAFFAKSSAAHVDVKLGLVSLHIVLGALTLGTAVALALKLHRDLVPQPEKDVKPLLAPVAVGAGS
jgi:cytochrome c oxidase assembly protein subunit 15